MEIITTFEAWDANGDYVALRLSDRWDGQWELNEQTWGRITVNSVWHDLADARQAADEIAAGLVNDGFTFSRDDHERDLLEWARWQFAQDGPSPRSAYAETRRAWLRYVVTGTAPAAYGAPARDGLGPRGHLVRPDQERITDGS